MNVNEVQSALQNQLLNQPRKTARGLRETTATPPSSTTPTKEHPAALTNSERAYFEQLFPEASDEVRSYSPYQRDRGTVPARLGTLLDRKG